jgi:cytochrome P450
VRWKGHPKLPDGAFIPFGIGPRKCAGDLFALTELTLIVASVCQHFRVDPLNATPVPPRPLITLRPSARIDVRPMPWT